MTVPLSRGAARSNGPVSLRTLVVGLGSLAVLALGGLAASVRLERAVFVDGMVYLPDDLCFVLQLDVAAFRQTSAWQQAVPHLEPLLARLTEEDRLGTALPVSVLSRVVVGVNTEQQWLAIVETLDEVPTEDFVPAVIRPSRKESPLGEQTVVSFAGGERAVCRLAERRFLLGRLDLVQRALTRGAVPEIAADALPLLQDANFRAPFAAAGRAAHAGPLLALLGDGLLAASAGMILEAEVANDLRVRVAAPSAAGPSDDGPIGERLSTVWTNGLGVRFAIAPQALSVSGGPRDLVGISFQLPAAEMAGASAMAWGKVQLADTEAMLAGVGAGLLKHHEEKTVLPDAMRRDDPEPLSQSWRIRVLPYVGEQALYNRIDFGEPLDGDKNRRTLANTPKAYRSVGGQPLPADQTSVLLPVSRGTAFGQRGTKLRHLVDGPQFTIFAVEAAAERAVRWNEPEDLDYDPQDPWAGLVGQREGGFLAVFGDGHVRFIPRGTDDNVLRALMTGKGRDNAQPFFRGP